MLKAFSNFSLFSRSKLINAIHQGDTAKALELIRYADTVNFRLNPIDLTPLQLSLYKMNNRLTVALLEQGADPNAPFLSSESLGTTFSVQIVMKNLDNIKLLILHGAEFNKTDWQAASEPIKDLITATVTLYQEIIGLQHNRSLKPPDNDTRLNYRRLQKIWGKLAENEINPIYRQYYKKKSSEALSQYIDQDTQSYKNTIKLQ